MINFRITGDVRPTSVTVLTRFICESCGESKFHESHGEEFNPPRHPEGWTLIDGAYGGVRSGWYCPRHTVKIEDRK